MTGNPALNENTFSNVSSARVGEAMTVQGTVHKTAILLVLAAVSASYTWHLYFGGNVASVTPWMIGGGIGGFVVGLVTTFKPTWAAITAPLYAVFQGLFIGALSSIFDARMPGIVIQAVMLTFGTLAALLAAYQTGLIRASDKFKRGVIAATGGIAILYLLSIALGFFHIQIPLIFGNGAIGIGFSLFVVILAAMNLVIDFDFIEQGAQNGAPKYMEWYASFGLMVTLIWLYMEILRLLSKLRSRD